MEDLKNYINTLRHDFSRQTLDEADVNQSPFLQFEKWFKEAVDSKVNEPNAMTVATVSSSGQPSARILLLRNFNENGFVFYTNYTSRKGENIADNPKAALLFFWPELERQVRIEGTLPTGMCWMKNIKNFLKNIRVKMCRVLLIGVDTS